MSTKENIPRVALIRMSKIYESLRYNEYSAENGLGEIVDNSIEARAANIYVDLTIEKVRKEGKKRATDGITQIIVTDDGCGMDRDTLHRCLMLGESIRVPQGNRRGIGRFGVGMTLGSISLARRIEVYSRADAGRPFLYTFIDLDEIRDNEVEEIPVPVEKEPPHADRLKGKSGTVVILSRCDRLESSSEGFANYLGRTYRKFIQRGVKIWLNDVLIYLHDPLYMAGPTRFDAEQEAKGELPDPKAKPLGDEARIPLPIPGRDGETADVVIRMSLLPKEWRTEIGDGGKKFAKERKIEQNEGISILRADREVLYDIVPYIIGPRGQAKTQRIDRWWGCEISFPPELDDYFSVRYIKRGAEPDESLREKIREKIFPIVKTAQAEIQEDRKIAEAERASKRGVYESAEEAMAKAEHSLPRSQRGRSLTPEAEENELDKLASTETDGTRTTAEEKAEKKAALKSKPYSIQPVTLPSFCLFETTHLLNNIVIQLNVNHPFYKIILEPLFDNGTNFDSQKERDKTAILLLLFSYAKAESMFDNNESLFNSLRFLWGSALAAALEEYQKGECNV